MAETFAVLGTDDPAWDATLAAMPYDLRDVHFTRGWGRLQEGSGVTAHLAVWQADWFSICQPFILRPIPDSDYWDVAAVGYGGPICNAALLALDDGAGFLANWNAWLAQQRVVSEFYALNPVIAAMQLPLIPRDWRLTYERGVTILPIAAGLDLIKANRQQSIRKARGATTGWAMLPEDFASLYGQAMDRKGAPERWRFDAEYFERMQATLGDQMSIIYAHRPERGGGLPDAAAIFLSSHGSTAYYYLAARRADAHDGMADTVISAALEMLASKSPAYLHLGGGLKDGDSLDAYKSSFGGYRRPVYSVRRVLDEVVYHELVGGYGAYPNPFRGFFPAYRAKEAQPA